MQLPIAEKLEEQLSHASIVLGVRRLDMQRLEAARCQYSCCGQEAGARRNTADDGCRGQNLCRSRTRYVQLPQCVHGLAIHRGPRPRPRLRPLRAPPKGRSRVGRARRRASGSRLAARRLPSAAGWADGRWQPAAHSSWLQPQQRVPQLHKLAATADRDRRHPHQSDERAR
eukprot:scaffold61542_cov63-Phaeocystis_antarctica.AAC.4